MRVKMRAFGVVLMSMAAGGALLCSQQTFASPADDDPSVAIDEDGSFLQRTPKAKLADLAGSWAISLGGNTGCGLSTLYVTVELDAAGFGIARTRGSSTGCPPGDDPAEPFQIQSLNADGSGTAALSCGPGCGWGFIIQVPRGSSNTFTLVDVQNPNNVLVGTAARKW